MANLGVCGKLSTFRLWGAGMALSGSSYFSSEHTVYPPAGGYRVLSLLLHCEKCENVCSDFCRYKFAQNLVKKRSAYE